MAKINGNGNFKKSKINSNQSKIYILKSEIYNLAGSTHLNWNDSCGMTNRSEIFGHSAGQFHQVIPCFSASAVKPPILSISHLSISFSHDVHIIVGGINPNSLCRIRKMFESRTDFFVPFPSRSRPGITILAFIMYSKSKHHFAWVQFENFTHKMAVGINGGTFRRRQPSCTSWTISCHHSDSWPSRGNSVVGKHKNRQFLETRVNKVFIRISSGADVETVVDQVLRGHFNLAHGHATRQIKVFVRTNRRYDFPRQSIDVPS